MKKVFNSHYDVIHKFAERSQSEGRASNIFFENDILYSYGRHFEMAKFLDEKTILFNDTNYSVSTSKHQSIARQALSQYDFINICDLDYNIVFIEIDENLEKLGRARKPEIYIDNILSLWNRFLDAQNKAKKYKECQRYIVSTSKIYNGRYLQNKDVSSNVYKKRLQKIIDEILSENGTNEIIEKAKERARINKEKERQKEALQIEKFMQYKIDWLRLSKDVLRLSKDGQNVETSQRVIVSIEDAKKLYKLIKAGKDIKGYKIAQYTVISINGTLKIGCHNIDMNSVYSIGEKIVS